MRILVVSDTHGQRKELREVISRTKPFDYLIHCGDTEGLEHEIEREAGCPCTIVRGNNDFYTKLPDEAEIELEGVRIFVTHGHRYGVGYSPERVGAEAGRRNCRVACFGHTHRPCLDTMDNGVTLLNPGSLAYPRQEGRLPGYHIIEIDRFGKLHFTQNFLTRGPAKKSRFFW